MVTPAAKREAVAHACLVHGVSQRRACEALGVDRSSVRYRSTRAPDMELREAMKALALARRRFGYRRIHIMLQRQGMVMNLKKPKTTLCRGEAAGAPERWPQASLGHQTAHARPRRAEPSLESRLYQ